LVILVGLFFHLRLGVGVAYADYASDNSNYCRVINFF